MHRFSDILAQKMVELNQTLRQFSDNTMLNKQHRLDTDWHNDLSRANTGTALGWWITDDNCALFNSKLYNEYCAPVLEKVLNTLAPGNARRYQHSDSAMAHHLDMQRKLGINEVNYGPEVDVSLIREKMPDALVFGHIPPFLLRNESADTIRDRIIADFQKVGEDGRLVILTAGSLAAGTGVGRMRWLMQVTQDYTRYDFTS
jgi:uroporphyrinogen decarboxylase